MKNTTTAVFLIATLSLGAVAAPAMAQGQRNMEQDRGERGDRARSGQDRLRAMLELYDTDGDGSISQAEIDATRAERLATFDADGDGQLTLAEYEALWLDAMRERMVDQFQRHDDDGDGQVTADEFGEDFANIVARRDRNNDGVLNADDTGRPVRASASPVPPEAD